MNSPGFQVHPATPQRWPDLLKLFGPRGAFGGCWCMYFRMRSNENARAKAAERKDGMRRLVESGAEPGLIAYVDGEPAGWVSLDRRENFRMLQYSRMYAAVDDTPVWTIVCFVVGRQFRRQGMMGRLLDAAVAHARRGGGRAIEAYPLEQTEGIKGYAGFTGIRSVFERAGFREVKRLANGRPVMRLYLTQP
jgi:GNAT superfamily N-acetyltransferase